MLMNYSEILKPFWKQIKKKEIPLKVKQVLAVFPHSHFAKTC